MSSSSLIHQWIKFENIPFDGSSYVPMHILLKLAENWKVPYINRKQMISYIQSKGPPPKEKEKEKEKEKKKEKEKQTQGNQSFGVRDRLVFDLFQENGCAVDEGFVPRYSRNLDGTQSTIRCEQVLAQSFLKNKSIKESTLLFEQQRATTQYSRFQVVLNEALHSMAEIVTISNEEDKMALIQSYFQEVPHLQKTFEQDIQRMNLCLRALSQDLEVCSIHPQQENAHLKKKPVSLPFRDGDLEWRAYQGCTDLTQVMDRFLNDFSPLNKRVRLILYNCVNLSGTPRLIQDFESLDWKKMRIARQQDSFWKGWKTGLQKLWKTMKKTAQYIFKKILDLFHWIRNNYREVVNNMINVLGVGSFFLNLSQSSALASIFLGTFELSQFSVLMDDVLCKGAFPNPVFGRALMRISFETLKNIFFFEETQDEKKPKLKTQLEEKEKEKDDILSFENNVKMAKMIRNQTLAKMIQESKHSKVNQVSKVVLSALPLGSNVFQVGSFMKEMADSFEKNLSSHEEWKKETENDSKLVARVGSNMSWSLFRMTRLTLWWMFGDLASSICSLMTTKTQLASKVFSLGVNLLQTTNDFAKNVISMIPTSLFGDQEELFINKFGKGVKAAWDQLVSAFQSLREWLSRFQQASFGEIWSFFQKNEMLQKCFYWIILCALFFASNYLLYLWGTTDEFLPEPLGDSLNGSKASGPILSADQSWSVQFGRYRDMVNPLQIEQRWLYEQKKNKMHRNEFDQLIGVTSHL